MANRFPLVANVSSSRIAELASGDGLDLSGSDIVNAANVSILGTSTLGPIGNVKITGGVNGQAIVTDGTGNLSFVTAATLAGANTEIQYNNNGVFGAEPFLTYDSDTRTLYAYNTSTRSLSSPGTYALNITSAGVINMYQQNGDDLNIGFGGPTGGNVVINGGPNVDVTGNLNVSSGNITASSNISGSNISATTTMKVNSLDVGTLIIPQNSQSTNYTLVLSDSGKQILHPSADTTTRTFTIPANSSVPFSIGTCVTFINQSSAGNITIAITTDTMRLAGAGSTGARLLQANGIATCIKLTSTEWIISGVNLT
jgi:hypothetical protein